MEPKVSPFKVPERHRKWVDIAEELSRDAFAPRAAMVDAENRFPFENYDDLRASGLLPLMVPERYGGIGADSFTYATILSKIAQGCASTGLTFNMHSAILFFLRQIATPDQQERYFGEVVTDGAVFSSITSEPGISFRHKGKIRTHIERDGDGYRLTGRKIFCSLSTGATYYFTWSFLEGAESLADGLLTVLIPAGRDGITILDDWDTLGMRGTASNSIDFESVRIEPEEVVGDIGAILGQNMSIWSVGYTAVYIGIAEAAFEYCVNAMRAPRSDGSPPRSEEPLTWQQIGRLSMQLEGARRARDTLGYLSGELDTEALTYVLNQAKYLATEAAHDITTQGMRLLGGRGLHRALPMERYLRDAMAGLVMPPANERCLETVGKLALGLPAKTVEFV